MNLAVIGIALSILNLVGFALGLSDLGVFAILWLLVVVMGLVHLFVGMYIAGADASLYRSVAHLPRYALWKVGVYLKMISKRGGKEWVRTTREP